MLKRSKLYVIASFILLSPMWLYACPSCKYAVEQQGMSGLSLGYAWSIILLLSVPYLLIGGLFLLIIRERRKKRLRRKR